MNFVLDTHTHSIASGHAYSTMNEMIEYAKSINLQLLGITEHAPAMPGTCNQIYFMNLKVIPRTYDNLTLMFGAETNILNYNGDIDLPDFILDRLDYAIASLHGNVIKSGSIVDNTNAITKAMENKYIKIIGHPDDGNFPLDYEEIVSAAAANHVLLEVNNTSLKPTSFRVGARDHYLTMLEKCKKYNVPVSLGSDAHICTDIGDFSYIYELFNAMDFPKELVVNTSVELFKEFIA